MSFSSAHIYTYLDLQYRLIYYNITGINDELVDVGQKHLWHFFTAYLYIASEAGSLTAECEVTEAGGVLLLTVEDGAVYAFNPKAGINYSWNDKKKHTHALYLAFAVSHREPTRSDLTDADKENRPKPERLYDIEAGYRVTGKQFAFNANAYFMYYDNQLVLTGEISNTGAALMTNAKKSFRTGVELIARYQPVRWFTWNINATFSHNKIIDYTDFIDDWDNGGQRRHELGTRTISFSPAIVASNDFTFTPVSDFNISFITKFVSKQYLDNSQDENLIIKPYCVSNLQFDYTLHTGAIADIGFFFHINNIFNHKYISNGWRYKWYEGDEINYSSGYFPQAGINFFGGIRLKFQ